MKSKCTKALAATLSVMMVLFTALSFPALNVKAFDNSVKQGVVAIVFYLKNAGIYITDGTNIEEIKHVGDTEFSGGSGFFIGEKEDSPSYIVTNCHVIDSYVKANEGETFVWDTGQKYQDTYPIIVGAPSCELRVYYAADDYDIAYVDSYGDVNKVDLAVLKLKNPTTKRHALKLQKPAESMVGETIYTIGFPGNADNQFTGASKYGIEDATVHKGVINRFGTNEGKGVERIAIDATVQHGNSGGPLVNEAGNVLGVNTNVESKSPYEGQVEADYYAISSNELITFLNKNNIPYMDASNQVNVGLIVLIACIVGGVLLLGGGAVVVLLMLKKKKAAPTSQSASAPVPESYRPSVDSFNATPSAVDKPVNAGAGISDYGATAAPVTTTAKAIIRSASAQHNGQTYPVGKAPVTVGRNAAECVIVYQPGTPGVSGKHCTISFDSSTEEFTITDLGSTFGTYLSNGEKLTANMSATLKSGDSIFVGDKSNELKLELES